MEAQAGGPIQFVQWWIRRQPGLACRLAVLLPVMAIVQVYFLLNGTDLAYHLRVISLLSLWMVFSIVWQLLLDRPMLATASRVGNLFTDASILNALITQAGDSDGTLVIVYALLIVTVGLWFHEQLVWWSTGIVEMAFGVLLLYRPRLATPWHYPLAVAVTLSAVGAVTSFQVRRVRALSRFYDRRSL